MNGFERLQTMEKELKNPFVSQVVKYLLTRKDMESKYLDEQKTLNKMYEFIEQKALALCIDDKKKLENSNAEYSSVGLDDNQVHSWAIMYFSLPDKMLGLDRLKEKISKTLVRAVPNITKSKENKNVAKDEKEKQKETNKTIEKAQISLF